MSPSKRRLRIFLLLVAAASLTACGSKYLDSATSDTPAAPTAPTAPAGPTLNVAFALKQLLFSWAAVSGTDNDRLFQSPDGVAPLAQVGGNLTTT